MTADGVGVASHAGSRLLTDLADRTGLTEAVGAALAGTRRRRSAHDPGRVLDSIDRAGLAAVRSARSRARERLWAQRTETVGSIPDSRAGGRDWPGLRLVVDATLVTCHSDKEWPARR